jgi:parallel beta-helix repeat protein
MKLTIACKFFQKRSLISCATILLILLLAGIAGAATQINSCTVISSPGAYVLGQNIVNSANNPCIKINSSDVVFDGAGYTIDGIDSSNTFGVYVNNPYSGLSNVTVKNVTVTDWYEGIYYNNAPNGSVSNSIANSNLDWGIRISASSGTNLINNIANSNSNGIYLESSSNGLNDGNTANSNSNYGFYLTSSNGNVFNHNTANSNSNYGFQLSSSSGNVFNNNTVNSNSYMGMYLSSSSGNVFNNNTMNSSSYGVYVVYSNDNTLTNNTISLNNYGLTIYYSSNNKIFNNKFNNNNNVYGSPYYSNTWNTTKTSGENIIGGPYLGGNYWASPSGTGFSNICGDADSDGICDISYSIASGNIDPMPLSAVAQGTGLSVIESCSIISLPGNYLLNKSILNSGNNTCIRITSSDVVFDGAGYTIDGIDSSNTFGVYVNNPYSGLSNVTVKNVTVTDWYEGIYYNNAPNGSVSNSIANSNLDWGIRISSSSGTNLTNNIANSNSNGIYLESSSNGLNDGNTANSNSYGFYLTSSNGNVFNNNTANSNSNYGFQLSSSSGNVFNNNTMNSNYYGIYVYSSNDNTLTNNTLSLNSNYGLLDYYSSNNKIYNNKFNNNNNVYSNYGNIWNTTKTSGENIIGGPYLGGNYWANPSGTGFSETCIDADRDGLCDSSYNIASGNIDQLALKYINSTEGQPGTIPKSSDF